MANLTPNMEVLAAMSTAAKHIAKTIYLDERVNPKENVTEATFKFKDNPLMDSLVKMALNNSENWKAWDALLAEYKEDPDLQIQL